MKQTIYTMTEDELKTQNEKWEKFLAKYNCNHYYVILATKEYEERLNFYGITSKSPDSLKAKASALPVFLVEIGQDHCTPTFYAQFYMGVSAFGENFFYPEGCNYPEECNCNYFKNGFETPDAAYDYILGKASECNAKVKE